MLIMVSFGQQETYMTQNIHKIDTYHIRPFFIFYFTEYFTSVYSLNLPIYFVCKMKISHHITIPLTPPCYRILLFSQVINFFNLDYFNWRLFCALNRPKVITFLLCRINLQRFVKSFQRILRKKQSLTFVIISDR